MLESPKKKKDFTDRKNNKEHGDTCSFEKDTSMPLLNKIQEKSTTMQEVEYEQPAQPQEPQMQTCYRETHDGADVIDMPVGKTPITNDDPMSEFMDAVKKMPKENQSHPRITIVDFGGQSMYYAFHQIFLSPKTFYILVVDMTKKPDEKVHETEDKCGSRFLTWTYKGNLLKNFVSF